MDRFIFYLLMVLSLNCSAQNTARIVVKYIPFSSRFTMDIQENDFQGLSSQKNIMQVKFDTIWNRNLITNIYKRLNQLESENLGIYTQFYDLRIQCKIALNNSIDNFYFDRFRVLVFHGRKYPNDTIIADLIMKNLCQPTYVRLGLYPTDEKYWPIPLKRCFDTNEFKEIYGEDTYRKLLLFKKSKSEK
jgi:hypothetical protein